MTKDEVQQILESQTWHFAKTLSHMPHSYTRKYEWKEKDKFVEVCKFINENCVKEQFKLTGNYVYNYLYLGDFKYWVMERDKAPEYQILINRADPTLVY
jgi:hypothetical protein